MAEDEVIPPWATLAISGLNPTVGTGARQLFAPPLNPDPIDVEFDSNVLPASVDVGPGVLGAVAPDPTVAFAASEIRLDVTPAGSFQQLRASHLAMQSGADGVGRGISVLDTSGPLGGLRLGCYYTRVFKWWRQVGTSNNDGNILLSLAATAAGVPDFANAVNGLLFESDSDTDIRVQAAASGGDDSGSLVNSAYSFEYQAFLVTSLAIGAQSATFYTAPASGAWRSWGNLNYAGGSVLDRFAINQQNVNSAKIPGCEIVLCDFIRFSPALP